MKIQVVSSAISSRVCISCLTSGGGATCCLTGFLGGVSCLTSGAEWATSGLTSNGVGGTSGLSSNGEGGTSGLTSNGGEGAPGFSKKRRGRRRDVTTAKSNERNM